MKKFFIPFLSICYLSYGITIDEAVKKALENNLDIKNQVINEKIERLKQIYGIEIIFINPAYTSQECSNCGYVDKENRKDTQTFECKACGNKINAQVNGARNIFKRSSLRDLITPYTSKKKVLQILVKQYLERYKGCNSAPCELLRKNPYYRDYISNSEPLMCKE